MSERLHIIYNSIDFVLPLPYFSEGIIAEFVWGMCYYGIFVGYICCEEVIGAV